MDIQVDHTHDFRAYLAANHPEMMVVNPGECDTAMIGFVERKGYGPVPVYDINRLVEVIALARDCTLDDAGEWVQTKLLDVDFGPNGPLFLTTRLEVAE